MDGISFFVLDNDIHEKAIVENRCRFQKYYNSASNRSILNRESLINIADEIVQILGNYQPHHIEKNPLNKKYQVWVNSQISHVYTPNGKDDNGTYLMSREGFAQYVGASRIIDSTDAVEMSLRTGASTCAFSADTKEECEYFVRSCLKNKCCTTGYDYVNCLYGNETI